MSLSILCFADVRFPLERANGIQTMETCGALARRGHRVRLLVRPDTRTPARDPFAYFGVFDAPDLRIERVRVGGSPAARRVAALAQALAKAARLPGDHLVLTRDLGFAALYLRLRQNGWAPLVYESHGFAPTVSQARPSMLTGAAAASTLKQRRLYRREAFVWRAAHGYVTITRALAEELEGRFGTRPACAVIPDGARTDVGDAARWVFPPAGKQPVVGYSGHLYPWKGVDLLLDALVQLPATRGLIIGGHPSEPDAARLQDRSRQLGLASRVVFTGMLAPREVAGHLAAADVLVLPNPATETSARYTSPLKLFEYLALGRPIVASDLPAFREVLTDRHDGVLFEPGNASALAGAIGTVLSQPALAESLAREALETAKNFSWDRRAERLEALIQAAVAVTHSKRRAANRRMTSE